MHVGDESVEMLGSVLGSVHVPVGDDYRDTPASATYAGH